MFARSGHLVIQGPAQLLIRTSAGTGGLRVRRTASLWDLWQNYQRHWALAC